MLYLLNELRNPYFLFLCILPIHPPYNPQCTANIKRYPQRVRSEAINILAPPESPIHSASQPEMARQNQHPVRIRYDELVYRD